MRRMATEGGELVVVFEGEAVMRTPLDLRLQWQLT